ncbi:hypothetical protein C345_04072 [Cryptococcus neoformans A2-102-5]|nr:hypothetical protein C346_04197 [Cryptococcus neoformans var. grubii D17-1]OXG94946.1 hypothetical protein C345_04072 [Cryptococcus neoformans var. grubii A2-102-5]
MDIVLDSSQNKPVWHLTPLPLSQINPSVVRPQYPRGRHVPTLHSFCLATISRNFHFVEPMSFTGVHPVLVRRVFSRIRADRGYEEIQESEQISYNPDEATIWAYDALLEGADAGSFTLALPPIPTLAHLPPNPRTPNVQHPLNYLPSLFASSLLNPTTSLLTSLTLNGMDGTVNDQNVQALRYCTHLDVLWMKGCRITDNGIRLLGSALELPGQKDLREGRGLWRLRAWFLGGCRNVSDRSAKVFARWPGLVALDLRNTSCTETSIAVINRTSQAVFAGQNPKFQACNDGLVPLFASNLPPADIISSLCLTLIKLPNEKSDLVSLNITSTSRPIPDKFLPPSSRTVPSSSSVPTRGKFYIPGFGFIYGSNLSSCVDEDGDFQPFGTSVSLSDLSSPSHEDVFSEMEEEDPTPAEKRKRTISKKLNGTMQEVRKGQAHLAGKLHKEKKPSKAPKAKAAGAAAAAQAGEWWDDADGQAKNFYSAASASTSTYSNAQPTLRAEATQANARGQGEGDRRLMLVRVVHDQWFRLTYTTANSLAQTQMGMRTKETNWAREGQMAEKRGKMVGDIMQATESVREALRQAGEANKATANAQAPGRVRTSGPTDGNVLPTQTSTGSEEIVRRRMERYVVDPSSTTTTVPSTGSSSSISRASDDSQNPFKKPYTSKPFASKYYPRKYTGSARPLPPPPKKPSPFAPHSRLVGKTPSRGNTSISSSISTPGKPSPPIGHPNSQPSQPSLAPPMSSPVAATQVQERTTRSNPFAPKPSSVHRSSSPVSSAQEDDGLDFGFSSGASAKKRAFGGAPGGEGKRRGMKMFSGKVNGVVLKSAREA